MLAYLDALIAALAARDIAETDRLLAHPLARILSPEALADATAERRAAGTDEPAGTPLQLLQLRYRTAQLLNDAQINADAAEPTRTIVEAVVDRKRTAAHPPVWSDRRQPPRQQMELPLSA
ncbi:MAG: hypothetical protein ACREN6_01455 [Gemmatimonadaceae bacterium]